jgi:hypothetical protein
MSVSKAQSCEVERTNRVKNMRDKKREELRLDQM